MLCLHFLVYISAYMFIGFMLPLKPVREEKYNQRSNLIFESRFLKTEKCYRAKLITPVLSFDTQQRNGEWAQ